MNSGDVSVIDTLTNAIQATVPVQCCPISVAISPSGDRVFVARHQGFQGELDVIDTATNTVVSSLPLSQEAEDVKLIPSGSQAYVTNPFANAVTAIDIAAMQVLAVIPVGVLPLRLAIGPAVIGPEPAPRVIHVDIKPQDPSNTINPKSGGTIRVALLSTPEFPLFIPFSGTLINWVDFTSLRFGRTGTEESLVSCNSNGEDVNKDGLLDLICHFDIQRAGFQPGDTVGILNAKVFDGISLTGSDSVRIVP
jgi:YVTN family beta-propeller protein